VSDKRYGSAPSLNYVLIERRPIPAICARMTHCLVRPGDCDCVITTRSYLVACYYGRMRSETMQARGSDLERIIPTARLIGTIPGVCQ